jgi:DNA-directed RNA polymerase subunit K/omega
MADEDYESDIEIESDSESETKEVNPSISKKIIPKTDNESEDEIEPPSDNEDEDDDNDLDDDDSDNEDEDRIDEDDGQKTPIVITDLDIDLEEDDDDDDDDDDDENYLQKFGEDSQKRIIEEYHPELQAHNTDEIETLSRVVRNEIGQIVDPFHKTIPILSRYEKARILGERAKQLNAGAEPFVEIDETMIDGYLIALKELDAKKIPFIIQRPLPNGACEYWSLRDLEIL